MWPRPSPAVRVRAADAAGGVRALVRMVLLMKSAQVREKDVVDAEASLGLLEERQRAWLRDTVVQLDPTHPWAA